jgi:hypothetical protein
VPIIKGQPKENLVKRTITVPDALVERIQRYIEYADTVTRQTVTESQVFAQAAEHALKIDRDFLEWEGSVRGKSGAAKLSRDRGPRPLRGPAFSRGEDLGQREGAVEKVAVS